MSAELNCSPVLEYRSMFCEWYSSPLGQMLREMEAEYLSRVLSIRYNQLILQLGGLGWEYRFLNEAFFRNVIVIDRGANNFDGLNRIDADNQYLPIACGSIDVIIIPHALEFEDDQRQLLREAERVLKPGGRIFFLGFNPWSIYRIYHYLSRKRKMAPWCGNFVRRQTVIDWLRSMNIVTEVSTGFYVKSSTMISDMFEGRYAGIKSLAYAIQAVKRNYMLIPFETARKKSGRFLPVGALEPASRVARIGRQG